MTLNISETVRDTDVWIQICHANFVSFAVALALTYREINTIHSFYLKCRPDKGIHVIHDQIFSSAKRMIQAFCSMMPA